MNTRNQKIKFLAVLPDDAKAEINSFNYIISPSPKDAEHFIIGKLKKNKQVTYISFGPNTVLTHNYIIDTFFNIISIFTNSKCSIHFFIETSTLRIPQEKDSFYLVNFQSHTDELSKKLHSISQTDYIKFSIYIDEWCIILVSLPAFPPFASKESFQYKANGWRILMNPSQYPFFTSTPTFASIHFDISLQYETFVLQLLPSKDRISIFQANPHPSLQILLPEPTIKENPEPIRSSSVFQQSSITNQSSAFSNNPTVTNSQIPSEVDIPRQKSPDTHKNIQKIISDIKTPGKEVKNQNETEIELEEEETDIKTDIETAAFEADEARASAVNFHEDSPVKPNSNKQTNDSAQLPNPLITKQVNEEEDSGSHIQLPPMNSEPGDSDIEEDLNSEIFYNGGDQDDALEQEIKQFVCEQQFTIPALEDTVVFSTLFQQLFHEKWKNGAIARTKAAMSELSQSFNKRCTEDISVAKQLVESNDPSSFIAREEKKLSLLEQKSLESLNNLLQKEINSYKLVKEQSLFRQFQKICAERIAIESNIRNNKAKIRDMKFHQTQILIKRLALLKRNHELAEIIEKGNNAKEMIEKLAPEHQSMEIELQQLEKDRQALTQRRNAIKAKLEAQQQKQNLK